MCKFLAGEHRKSYNEHPVIYLRRSCPCSSALELNEIYWLYLPKSYQWLRCRPSNIQTRTGSRVFWSEDSLCLTKIKNRYKITNADLFLLPQGYSKATVLNLFFPSRNETVYWGNASLACSRSVMSNLELDRRQNLGRWNRGPVFRKPTSTQGWARGLSRYESMG